MLLLVMDKLTKSVQDKDAETPYCIMIADDVVLCIKNINILEANLNVDKTYWRKLD